VAGNEPAELFDAEPCDGHVGVDGGVAERFAEVALAGAGGAGDDEVLMSGDPLEIGQGPLGGGGDGEPGRVEGVEGLAGWEGGAASADLDGGGVTAARFFVEQDTHDFGGVPALRFGGGNDVAGVAAHVGHAQPSAQPVDLAERTVMESGGHERVSLSSTGRPM
jgi:hypothetical protein